MQCLFSPEPTANEINNNIIYCIECEDFLLCKLNRNDKRHEYNKVNKESWEWKTPSVHMGQITAGFATGYSSILPVARKIGVGKTDVQ